MIRRMPYVMTAKLGKVFVKYVDGKPLYAHKISTNLKSSLDEWEEIEEKTPVVAAAIFRPRIIKRDGV